MKMNWSLKRRVRGEEMTRAEITPLLPQEFGTNMPPVFEAGYVDRDKDVHETFNTNDLVLAAVGRSQAHPKPVSPALLAQGRNRSHLKSWWAN